MPSSACQTSARSEEHTSELQSHDNLVCRLLLEKKKEGIQVRRAERAGVAPADDPVVGGQAERSRPIPPQPTIPVSDSSRTTVLGNFFFNKSAPTEFSPFP